MSEPWTAGESGSLMRGGRPFYGFDLGLIMLDNTCPRPVGDVGNAKTWPFPVLFETAVGAKADVVVERSAEGLLGPFVGAAERLVGYGVRAIGTSCGFLAIYQRELVAAVPVPVATSSLLQIPQVLRLAGPGERVGVLTANASGLTDRHWEGVGITAEERTRVHVMGLEDTEYFYPAIVGGTAALDLPRAQQEIVSACSRAMAQHPDITAWVFECTNLPPYRDAVRAATGVPVFDAVTLLTWLHASTQP